MPYVWEGEVELSLVDEPWYPGGVSERPEEFAALEAKVRRDGFIEPLRVLKVGGRYRVYEGKSRFLIARKLGLGRVPVKVLWEF